MDSRKFSLLTLRSAPKLIIAVKKTLYCWKEESSILKCRSKSMIVANKTLFGVEKKRRNSAFK